MRPEREPSLLGCLWEAWKAYANRAGGYQAQVLLSAVYYLVLGPSALLARLVRTRLLDLDPPDHARGSYWIERPPLRHSLEALERQF